MQQGIEKGILQGLRESACDLIDVRFEPEQDTENIKKMIKSMDDMERLKTLKETIKTASSIGDLKAFTGN